jgi:predicted CXXCH cytochrome family protein
MPRKHATTSAAHSKRSRLFRLLLPAMSILAATLAPAPVHAGISFIYPVQNGLVTRSDYLVLKTNNPEITAIKIAINGGEGELLKIGTPEYRKAFRDFLILQAFWDEGKNSVQVEGYAGEKKLETAALDFYYRAKGTSTAGAGFASHPFHDADNERLCSPCHNMNPAAIQAEEALGKGNPCYVCHYKMINAPFVHGPAGTFSCSYCHSGRENPKYAAPRREQQLCAECHVDMVADIEKKKFKHGPVEAGMCEICHDLHSSANIFQLRAPINELCLSCHEKVGKDIHVTRLADGVGHPLSDRPDISQPGTGRLLSCVSCHDPHAANFRYYFRKNIETSMELCQMCHIK